jgi:hypothetical protein
MNGDEQRATKSDAVIPEMCRPGVKCQRKSRRSDSRGRGHFGVSGKGRGAFLAPGGSGGIS